MDANFARESIDQELRRRHLAQRLVAHQARTHTVFRLTGLSRHQQATMRRRWQVTTEMRRRGPLPKSFAAFFSTQRTRDEAAVLALLWRLFSSVAPSSSPARAPGRVEIGECFCDVFEAHLACFRGGTLELDHLLLLSRGLDEAVAVSLARCSGGCEAVMLADLLGPPRRRCSRCQHAESVSPLSAVVRKNWIVASGLASLCNCGMILAC
ncbi:hypothetical protein [Steroidobacter sp.]|uniref:hypothetical protein n=1 Tax=Steroidobacter sp. TaxID=1978227 RepID=UPI001A442978|nr:hypothetical protein [Steroidobacter sp.]MBL8268545.1 hypothetical protein [Steroidobacter sp.]